MTGETEVSKRRAKGTRFGAVLSRLRARAGFPSAYAFFKARGGARILGMAFANYLNLERGRSLPKGERVGTLAEALGVTRGSEDLRELLLAFLADQLGSEEMLSCLRCGGADPAPSSWLLMEGAARQTVSGRVAALSLDQYAALAADADAYACHVVLVNTRGGLTKAELRAELGLEARALERALARLQKAGLLEKSGERLRSPLQGKYVVPPALRLTPALASDYARLQEHRTKWLAERGAAVDARYLILRARRAPFERYLQHLADVVAMSAVYGDVEPAPDSEMYLVEGRVTRLFSARARAERDGSCGA